MDHTEFLTTQAASGPLFFLTRVDNATAPAKTHGTAADTGSTLPPRFPQVPTMKISAATRTAIRAAISAHPRWDDLRAEKGLSLSTMDKAAFIDVCDALNINILDVAAAADAAAADFPADNVSAAAQAVNGGTMLRNSFEPLPTTRKEWDARFTPAVDANSDLLPWSADKLARFDRVLSCVDEAASFSGLYAAARAAQDRVAELALELVELQNAATANAVSAQPLAQRAESAEFIAPSWSRDFEDFLSIGSTVALVGPAGNGKTTGAKRLLQAAGFNVYEMDCTDATMPQDIIGRTALRSVEGATVTEWTAGPLALAFADPRGALLLNEYDALDPRTGMSLQSALEACATRRATAPDSGAQLESAGPCPIVLTLNTIGHGATVAYQGRNALDGANRDRVEIIVTGYEHEAAIMVAHGIDAATASALDTWARNARIILANLNSTEVLSNRRLITAGKLMDGRGLSLKDATDRAFTNRMGEMAEAFRRGY